MYTNSSPVAHECALYWCTKTFTPTYGWGQLNENPSNVFYDSGQQLYPWQFYVNPVGKMVVNYVANFSLTPPIQHPPDANITYSLSNVTALQVLLLFEAILPSYLTLNVTSSQRFRYYNTPTFKGPLASKNISSISKLHPHNIATDKQNWWNA